MSRAIASLPAQGWVGKDARRRRVRRPARAAAVPLAFLLPVLVFAVLFFVYPLAKNVQVSLQDYNLSSLYTGAAPYVGLRNYTHLWHDPVFRTAVGNTIEFTLLSIFFQLTIGLGLAVFFVRNFPLNALLRSLLLVPWLLPLVVSGTVFRWMLDTNNGIVNHVLLELYEASALDGAGGWGQFRYITVPLLRPVLTVVTTLGLIYTLKIFDVIWVL